MSGPLWAGGTVWWHVYPLGFAGAERAAIPDGRIEHRLRRLEPWLDYARELGCSGLALGPIFRSETHGYDTLDHFRLDPRLGDEADFDALLRSTERRGMRVLLDGVFNHVGRGFPRFAEAVAGGRGSPAARWFRMRGPEDGGEPAFDVFEGHDQLVALQHDEPAVADYVTEVLLHWLRRGAAGWRLDAAYAVPAAFWRRVLPRVRAEHPDAWFVGEVIHGDYPAYVADSGLDSVTQYELWKAIWSSLNDRNLFELAWALGRHNRFTEAFLPLTFAGNHDVSRLATRLEDPRHLGHALAVLFTVAGTPSVYYGDEQAFQGLKEERAGGDDVIRPAFPDGPADLAPWGWPVYELHRRLIELRGHHPWLARARSEMLHVTNESAAVAVEGGGAGGGRLVLLLHVAEDAYRFPLDGAGLRVALSSDPAAEAGDPLLVPGHGWRILEAPAG